MPTITPVCEIAELLLTIEQRLREKTKQAASEFAVMGYAQASLEIAREGLVHYRHCSVCQAAESEHSAAQRRAA